MFSWLAEAIRVAPLPLPVHSVDKFVEGPWARWGAIFAFFAALFGGIATWVAIETLGKVKEQIGIANREVAFVREDLQNNRRMIDEALRHPDLRPMPDPVVGIAESLNAPKVFNVELWVSLRNVGERLARNVVTEWLIPTGILDNVGDRPARTVFGEEYTIFGAAFRKDQVFWPNGIPSQGPVVDCSIFGEITEATMLLRFYDDAGTYPRGAWFRYRYTREQNGRMNLEPLCSFVRWGS